MKNLSWIIEDNLKPFVETLSGFVGYRFDDWDWDAIYYGVRDTNKEVDRWYEYELIGDRKMKLCLARADGSFPIFVRVEADKDLEEKAAIAADIMCDYWLTDRPKESGRGPRSGTIIEQTNANARGTDVERNELLDRISIDPRICFGKPCIRGHRIWVSLILDLLASGMSVDDVLSEYPQLSREDALACIAYGAEMSRERFVEVPTERPA